MEQMLLILQMFYWESLLHQACPKCHGYLKNELNIAFSVLQVSLLNLLQIPHIRSLFSSHKTILFSLVFCCFWTWMSLFKIPLLHTIFGSYILENVPVATPHWTWMQKSDDQPLIFFILLFLPQIHFSKYSLFPPFLLLTSPYRWETEAREVQQLGQGNTSCGIAWVQTQAAALRRPLLSSLWCIIQWNQVYSVFHFLFISHLNIWQRKVMRMKCSHCA